MGMQKKSLVLFAAIFVLIGLTAQTMAYVPDGLLVSEQPETIDADGESTTDITIQLMADLDGSFGLNTGYEDVVKMCGIEVICESQDPDVLEVGDTAGTNHVKVSSSTIKGWTDEFGKVTFTYQSTGSEHFNEGNVTVICRSIQLQEGSSVVHVWTMPATKFHVTMCPKSGYDELEQGIKDELNLDPNFNLTDAKADIVADGSSHVYITAQLKNDYDNPVHLCGKIIEFKSMDTVIVETCDVPAIGTNSFGYYYEIRPNGVVWVWTDQYGVATAEFCSAGAGSENVGTANIHIKSVDVPNVLMNETNVTTTSQSGSTYKFGYIAMSSMADQIMADRESCVWICAQARDQDYRINRRANWQVLLESEETTLLVANPSADPYDEGLAYAMTDSEGIAKWEYCSNSDYDPNTNPDGLGKAKVIGTSATAKHIPSVDVDLRTEQIWPVDLEVKATMEHVDCDGVSTVTLTAQLLDRYGLATKYEGRRVTFNSDDIGKLKNTDDGGAVVHADTNEYGVAHATFVTTDCKFGGNDGTSTITVYTQSPDVSKTETVKIIKPLGFVPEAISVYTDQELLGKSDTNPAHAKPHLILADGQDKTYVTVQVCEMANKTNKDGCVTEYCNPVKRCGVELELFVKDDSVVKYKGDNDNDPNFVSGQVNHLVLKTDDEGKATAIFRSSGNGVVNKNKCTLIEVHAINSEDLGKAYAEVCTKGFKGEYPNSIWIWADPAIITADGTSHTVIRSALYFCYEGMPTIAKTKDQKPGDNYYNYLNKSCKPVHMPGVTVKFETLNTDALDDGMGGYKVYDITDEFGHAHATFQSKGFDKQHMGTAEIEAWTIGSGEDVIQLNTLIVGLEEKTWPWCPPQTTWFEEGSPASIADAIMDGIHDQYITDGELIKYLFDEWYYVYATGGNTEQADMALLVVVQAWEQQL